MPSEHRARATLPPIVSVVAKSGTGKTTLSEALIPYLNSGGLEIGIVKQHSHVSSFDTPGKDTHRLAEAGVEIVVGVSPVQVAVFRREIGRTTSTRQSGATSTGSI
jgi:molybdopterin-guanine dinucleotide biosynthesis protein MobB